MSDDKENFEMDWSQLKTIKTFDKGIPNLIDLCSVYLEFSTHHEN